MNMAVSTTQSTMILRPLNSVGCFLDLRTLLTYPINENGRPDYKADSQIFHISDCCDQWIAQLTDDERMSCNLY